MAENVGYGQQTPFDPATEHGAISFIIAQAIAGLATIRIVKVVEVTLGEGDPPAPATVAVQPLVNMIDGNQNKTEHGTVYGIPVFRFGAGNAAVIIDPVVGDIGFIACCDRDSSAVKENQAAANPSTFRVMDMADGIYLGKILGAAPASFLQFLATGYLKLADANGNVLETSAQGFVVTTAGGGDFVVNGISVTQHRHGGVTLGAPANQTLPPTAPP